MTTSQPNMSDTSSSFEVPNVVESPHIEIQEPEPAHHRILDSSHLNIFQYVNLPEIREQEIRIAPNSVVKSVNSLYPTRVLYNLLSSYLACVFMEYLLCVGQLPFESIKNRPLICQFNAFVGFCTV